MYNVMIVDDDQLARIGLMHSVCWQEYDMQVILDTPKGEVALEFARNNRVDLAFIDLEMPGMFGLDLLRALKTACKETHCVILTMHDDFKYIQEALRVGVLDYIIKTELDTEHVDSMMQRLKNRIEAREAHGEGDNLFAEQEHVSSEIKRCILKAMALVKDEKGVYLSATEVATRVNMSRSYFSTCFKQLVGVSFNEYFKKIRLEQAKSMLVETHLPISRIAEAIGFTDESYFSTVFKAYTGKRPSDYRKV